MEKDILFYFAIPPYQIIIEQALALPTYIPN
jgi:hypothetical protein